MYVVNVSEEKLASDIVILFGESLAKDAGRSAQ